MFFFVYYVVRMYRTSSVPYLISTTMQISAQKWQSCSVLYKGKKSCLIALHQYDLIDPCYVFLLYWKTSINLRDNQTEEIIKHFVFPLFFGSRKNYSQYPHKYKNSLTFSGTTFCEIWTWSK